MMFWIINIIFGILMGIWLEQRYTLPDLAESLAEKNIVWRQSSTFTESE